MHIGVFDSGKGGSFIATRLQKLVPGCSYVVVDDAANVPYGSRTKTEIIELTDQAIQRLIPICPIIIIACNTATTAGITELRRRHPATTFIGIEPMLKPAEALTKTGHITVLATPSTLRSERYLELKQLHASSLVVDEPDTHDWARKIESGLTQDISLENVRDSVARGSDILVLACTHYIGIKDDLQRAFPTVRILEPSDAIAQRLTHLLGVVSAQAQHTTSIGQGG